MPFDRETQVGSEFVACTYDVDAREVRDEGTAVRLLARTRERVKEGRSLRPGSAHYVNLVVAEPVHDAVRSLISNLGQNDGIDSVAVSGLTLADVPAREVKAIIRLNRCPASGQKWPEPSRPTRISMASWSRQQETRSSLISTEHGDCYAGGPAMLRPGSVTKFG